jgi:hypothetical protein
MIKEQRLINQFKEEFREKFGYTPMVITKGENAIPLMSLSELKAHFISMGFDLDRRDSKRERSEIRFIYCHLAREMNYSLEEIGSLIDRDHTTIRYNLTSFNNLHQTSSPFNEKLKKIIKTILEKHGK